MRPPRGLCDPSPVPGRNVSPSRSGAKSAVADCDLSGCASRFATRSAPVVDPRPPATPRGPEQAALFWAKSICTLLPSRVGGLATFTAQFRPGRIGSFRSRVVLAVHPVGRGRAAPRISSQSVARKGDPPRQSRTRIRLGPPIGRPPTGRWRSPMAEGRSTSCRSGRREYEAPALPLDTRGGTALRPGRGAGDAVGHTGCRLEDGAQGLHLLGRAPLEACSSASRAVCSRSVRPCKPSRNSARRCNSGIASR